MKSYLKILMWMVISIVIVLWMFWNAFFIIGFFLSNGLMTWEWYYACSLVLNIMAIGYILYFIENDMGF